MPLQNTNTNTVPTFKKPLGKGETNYRIEIENLTSGSVEVGGLIFNSNNIVNINFPIQLINPPNILPNTFFNLQLGIVAGIGNNNFGIAPPGSGWTIAGNTTEEVLNITTSGTLTQFTFQGQDMSQVTDINNQTYPCSTALDGVLIETIPNAEFIANYITI